jgi:hypothetical protein
MLADEFGKAFPGADNPSELFEQVDEDGDGKVTLSEWMNWHEQGFTAATEASGGQMPIADYEAMDWEKGAYVRPSQADSGTAPPLLGCRQARAEAARAARTSTDDFLVVSADRVCDEEAARC